MNIYEAIFKRKSVRKYKDEKLSKELLNKIREISNDLDLLYNNAEIEVQVVEEGMKIQKLFKGFIGNYIKVKAPHYLVITSNKKEGYLQDIGYALEKVVLVLTTMGIGTCWIGAPFKKEELKDVINFKKEHEPILLISFGEAQDFFNMYRDDIKDYKRKDFADIVKGKCDEELRELINAARVAPSATNSQPWRFEVEEGTIHVYKIKRSNFVTKKIYDSFNNIDIGIALNHISIAAQYSGKSISFMNINKKQQALEYVTSIKIQ